MFYTSGKNFRFVLAETLPNNIKTNILFLSIFSLCAMYKRKNLGIFYLSHVQNNNKNLGKVNFPIFLCKFLTMS